MENKKVKAITWRKLKKFCNSLPEKELKKPVQWWGEERGGDIQSAYQLPEDYVQTDYGCEPASVQEYEEGDEPYEIAHKKGTPILHTDM